MGGPRRLLLIGLIAILIVLNVTAHLGTIWVGPRPGVDVQIPLLAAERWLAGGAPYVGDAFTSGPGSTQPFLYPPYTLPFYAAMTSLPPGVVLGAAVLVMLVVAVATCRRLGVPWVWMPVVLAWPPFAEGILDGNLQTMIFGAFVFLFYRPPAGPWHPDPRDIADPVESPTKSGWLAAFIGAVKVSQPHPWVFVLRHRWRAALLGAATVVVVVVATLPLTGTDLWFDWVAQLRRASDTTWDLGGFALPRFLPFGAGYAIAAICLVAVWFVPRRDPAPWLGVLSVIGSLSLHIFGLLFLVPAMLMIRREAAIVAAAFIATYSYEGSWAGAAVVLWCLLVVTFGGATWSAQAAARAPSA